jgi:predicted TIM-barrel fold metal-dependent hydrolase
MKTFGKKKVCFATDFPLLPFDRVLSELDALQLSDEVRRLFLRDNARRVLKL